MPQSEGMDAIWSVFNKLAKTAATGFAASVVATEEMTKLRLWMTVMVMRYDGKLVIPADEIELTEHDTMTVIESYENGDTVLRAVKR